MSLNPINYRGLINSYFINKSNIKQLLGDDCIVLIKEASEYVLFVKYYSETTNNLEQDHIHNDFIANQRLSVYCDLDEYYIKVYKLSDMNLINYTNL